MSKACAVMDSRIKSLVDRLKGEVRSMKKDVSRLQDAEKERMKTRQSPFRSATKKKSETKRRIHRS